MRTGSLTDSLDRRRRRQDPGRIAIVTSVVPAVEDGNSVYRVNLVMINSGSVNVDHQTKTISVEGGEEMVMSKGGEESPDEWNTGSSEEDQEETDQADETQDDQ